MTCGNAVLSENQNDFEACLTGREYADDLPAGGIAESTSSTLFSTVAARRHHALSGKNVNGGFAGIVGESDTLGTESVTTVSGNKMREWERGHGPKSLALWHSKRIS